MFSVSQPSQPTMQKIFVTIMNGFLADFATDIRSMAKPVVDASVEVFERICRELLPTPAKSHYTFNLRDLSKVIQGVLQCRPAAVPDKESMARLFVHESMRVFHDRLINKQDRRYFTDMLIELLKRHFSISWQPEVFEEAPIVFGDFMRPGASAEMRVYEHVKDLNKCTRILEEYQDDYNSTLSKDMNLVFFTDAIAHVARISRIIRQRRGNAMLVGVGGTAEEPNAPCVLHGRVHCFSIELTKGYGTEAFREDLKSCTRLRASRTSRSCSCSPTRRL